MPDNRTDDLDLKQRVERLEAALSSLAASEDARVRRAVAREGLAGEVLLADPDWRVRAEFARRGQFAQTLAEDPAWQVRAALAESRSELDRLSRDEDWHVREQVALRGHDPERMANDPDPHVRVAAMPYLEDPSPMADDPDQRVRAAAVGMGVRLDELSRDRSQMVRAAVARRGACLDALKSDTSALVRAEVARHGFAAAELARDRAAGVREALADAGYALDVLWADPSLSVRNTALGRLASDGCAEPGRPVGASDIDRWRARNPGRIGDHSWEDWKDKARLPYTPYKYLASDARAELDRFFDRTWTRGLDPKEVDSRIEGIVKAGAGWDRLVARGDSFLSSKLLSYAAVESALSSSPDPAVQSALRLHGSERDARILESAAAIGQSASFSHEPIVKTGALSPMAYSYPAEGRLYGKFAFPDKASSDAALLEDFADLERQAKAYARDPGAPLAFRTPEGQLHAMRVLAAWHGEGKPTPELSRRAQETERAIEAGLAERGASWDPARDAKGPVAAAQATVVVRGADDGPSPAADEARSRAQARAQDPAAQQGKARALR